MPSAAHSPRVLPYLVRHASAEPATDRPVFVRWADTTYNKTKSMCILSTHRPAGRSAASKSWGRAIVAPLGRRKSGCRRASRGREFRRVQRLGGRVGRDDPGDGDSGGHLAAAEQQDREESLRDVLRRCARRMGGLRRVPLISGKGGSSVESSKWRTSATRLTRGALRRLCYTRGGGIDEYALVWGS